MDVRNHHATLVNSPLTACCQTCAYTSARDHLLLLGGEWRRRQASVHLVENEHLDIRLGLLLLPETVELGEMRLYRRQQVAARLFDALPLSLCKIVVLQQVEQRELVLIEAFLDCALLLRIQLVHEFHQLTEGLLDVDTVLLAVVVVDDLLVLLLIVHARRVAR